jgi:DmsE family decaheme c-type cytochrome
MPLRSLLGGLLLALCTISARAEIGCLDCHKASADDPVHSILQTAHGRMEGGGNNACIACHGASESHKGNPAGEAPDRSFGPRWALPAEGSNAVCLECHQRAALSYWSGSVHEQEEMTCTSCHDAHARTDPMLTAEGALAGCLDCHQKVATEIRLPSRHPVLEGKTACADCHNPHGSGTDAALNEPTLNDSCYSCHAEKRGPHLWEHPPVAEDCSLCHLPHGAVNERLLSSRGPFLCQQCHSAAFHPSLLNSGGTVADRSNNHNLMGKNCQNCHSQVHGSNHPSGARLTR